MSGFFRSLPDFRPFVCRIRTLLSFQSCPTLPPVSSYFRTCSSPNRFEFRIRRNVTRRTDGIEGTDPAARAPHDHYVGRRIGADRSYNVCASQRPFASGGLQGDEHMSQLAPQKKCLALSSPFTQ